MDLAPKRLGWGNQETEKPDDNCSRGVNSWSLSSWSIFRHRDSKWVETGNREHRAVSKEEDVRVIDELFDSKSCVFKSSVFTEQSRTTRHKLDYCQEYCIESKTPDTFPSDNIKRMEVVISKELFFSNVHASMEELSSDHENNSNNRMFIRIVTSPFWVENSC